jgi:hypothetical protein
MFFEHTVMELLGVAQRFLQQAEVVLGCCGSFLQRLPLALELVDRLVRDDLTGVHASEKLQGGIGDWTRFVDGLVEVCDLLGDGGHDFSCSTGCNIYYYK